MQLYAKFAVILAITVAAQGLIERYGWEVFFGIRCQIALLTRDEQAYDRLLVESAERTNSLLVLTDLRCKFVDSEATTVSEPPPLVVEASDVS